MIISTKFPIKHFWVTIKNLQLNQCLLTSQTKYGIGYKSGKSIETASTSQLLQNQAISQQKQAVLKTYLQIIPPYRIQQLLHPDKTNISEFTNLPEGKILQKDQLEKLHKKIKKSVHMIPIQSLTKALQSISHAEESNAQCKALSRKIYTKIVNNVYKKLNTLSLQQIVDFMYKMVKLNYKEFQFMKEVQRVIIEQKIKINYPLIRKILWVYTHLDAGSSVLYSHISKTLKIGQHEFSPLQLAESAYMLSKTSQNATGGYGVFLIAQKHLLAHLPRLQFHDLVKAASYMFTQNIGSNEFQLQLQAQLYKKYPNKPNLRLNDLVTLLKSTSGYYFKYKQKALLNMLQTSTRKVAPQANLQQFQDIIWSWGRAGKGDKQLWGVLEEQINNRFIHLLKPRQLAFFYYSLCSNEYASAETIKEIQKKFMNLVTSNPSINKHYLLKFLLGMQKRKDYSQNSFAKISSLISQHMDKLSIKQLVTFAKIINESDLCYENKQKFKEMEKSLLFACKSAIMQRIYMFRINELVEVLYMWIKLDVSDGHKLSISQKFVQTIFSHLSKSTHQIPKSVFIKSLFCFTIKDKYQQSIQMIAILQSLLKYGPVSYFFSPLELPLAAYCVFHLVVNGENKIHISNELIYELGQAIDKINPVILNKFVRNGYEQCLRLKNKYYEAYPEAKNEGSTKRKKK